MIGKIENDFELQQKILLFKKGITKNWWIILIFLAIGTVLGVYYNHKEKTFFKVTSQLLLKSEDTYDYQGQLYSNLGAYSMYSDIVNQKRVIRSHDMILKVIQNIELDERVYIKGRIKSREIFHDIPFNVSINYIHPLINGKLEFQFIDNNSYRLTYLWENERKEFVFNFGEQIATDVFILEINKSAFFEVISEVPSATYLLEDCSDKFWISYFLSRMEIENFDYTSILQLSVTDEVHARAKLFLDELSKVYISYSIDNQVDVIDNTVGYIDQQLVEIYSILDSIEYEIELFKESEAILDLEKQSNTYFSKLLNTEEEITKNENKLKFLGEVNQYILDEGELPLLKSIYVIENDVYLDKLLMELQKLKSEKNNSSYDYTNSSNNITLISNQIELVKRDIVLYIEQLRITTVGMLKSLNISRLEQEKRLKRIPKSQLNLLKIERKRAVNEKLYLYLLEKRANAVIAKAGVVPQTKVIETARLMGIKRTPSSKIYMITIGICILISLIIAVIRTLFFTRVESVRELKIMTSHPIIGGIPLNPNFNIGYMKENMKDHFTENMRIIRSNLRFLMPDLNQKTIMITSLFQGDGKSFTSLNIATILGMAQKKVVIIDCDLHRPKLAKQLMVKNETGISDVLIGKREIVDVIFKYDFFDFVTSGPIPPNASELLLSESFGEMLTKLREEYEYLIIDSPPFIMTSDNLSIIENSDASIFVLNVEKTTNRSFSHLDELISRYKINNAGLILNGVSLKNMSYSYNNYSYENYR